MKKQFLLLFAASALFAACSSDEMPNSNNEVNNGQEQTEIENYASSYGVTTEEGIGISVGLFGEEAETRAETKTPIHFDVTPAIADFMKEHFDGYEIKVDDFYIRKNGVYLDAIPMESPGSYISENGNIIRVTTTGEGTDVSKFLTVRVQGLQYMEYNSSYNDDYTFEVYMWVERTTPKLEEGTGANADLFDLNQKKDWISGWGEIGKENILNSGIDITKQSTAELAYTTTDQSDNKPSGYLIRYNVFRGLSGYQEGLYDENGIYIGDTFFDENGEYIGDGSELGNTPYVKVSIHINRLEDTAASSITPIYPTED